MTKAKRILTCIISIFVFALSLGLFGLPKNINYATAESADISNLFIRDSSFIVTSDNNLFIFDKVDSKIKKQSLSSPSTEYQTKKLDYVPLAIEADATNLFVVEENALHVYNHSTFEEISLQNLTDLTDFSFVFNISLFSVSLNEVMLVLIPKSNASKQLVLLKVNFEDKQITNKYTITFADNFESSNLANGIDYASILSIQSSTISLFIACGEHFYNFSFDMSTEEEVSSLQSITLSASSVITTIIDDNFIIIGTTPNSVDFYSYVAGSASTTLLGSIDAQNVQNLDAHGSTLLLNKNGDSFSAESYSLELTDTPSILTTRINEYKNEEFENNVRHKTSFRCYSLLSDANIYTSPYSNQYISLSEGTHVTLLGIPTTSGIEFGYSYVLVTQGTQNIFGFIDSTLLEALSNTSFDYNYAYVIDGTNLYNLPSNVTSEEDGNLVQAKISMNDKVRIISTMQDASLGGRQYLLVEACGKIGFILRDRVSGKALNYNLVLTNAYLKDNVNVYKSADVESEIIDKLSAGDRVRVISTRRIDSQFLEVKYNDIDGNEVRGFIQSSAIQTDSWSMLQIVGMVLVLVNLVFLVVILAVRKKINKD